MRSHSIAAALRAAFCAASAAAGAAALPAQAAPLPDAAPDPSLVGKERIEAAPEPKSEAPASAAPSFSAGQAAGPKGQDDAKTREAARRFFGKELDELNDSQKATAMLLADKALTETLINRAVVDGRWDWLAFLVPLYDKIDGRDEILVWYAGGALDRNQGRHKRAIEKYRKIIAKDPSLSYVRLDLAAMLYEDKQYAAAKDQFRKVDADDVTDSAHEIARAYIEQINRQETADVSLGLNYERNDNINNASDTKIVIGPNGSHWEKDEDSLPKSANGARYNFGVSRDANVAGNHYLTLGASVYGVAWWDKPDFSEYTLRGEMGWRLKSAKSWASVVPYASFTDYGGAPYSGSLGVSAEAGVWLNPKWQVGLALDASRTRYTSYERFNGWGVSADAFAAYFPASSTMLSASLSASRDKAKDDAETNARAGGSLTWAQEWPWGLSTRLTGRYSHKEHKDPAFFFNVVRKDDDYGATLTVWHRSLSLWGITPKLNFARVKTTSTIPELYNRDSNRVYVSFGKTF